MSDQDDRLETQAGEFVLGTLDAEARAKFAERLKREPDLRDRVEAWHRRLEGLDSGVETEAPPPELWDRIAGALDEGAAVPPDIPGHTVPAGDRGWYGLLPGVEKKVLFVDRDAGFESYLLRIEAGGWLPAHEHDAIEECLMLEGEIQIGALRLRAGDYHVTTAGTAHPEIHSAQGAVAYLRSAIHT